MYLRDEINVKKSQVAFTQIGGISRLHFSFDLFYIREQMSQLKWMKNSLMTLFSTTETKLLTIKMNRLLTTSKKAT